jgi:hypothetical protein
MSSRLIARIRSPRDEFRPAALTLRDVTGHPDGAAALQELAITYVITETAGGLLFTQHDADLRLYLYDLPAVLGAARRNAERREQEARRTGKRYGPEDLASGPTDLESARHAIFRLETHITQLLATRKDIVGQREHWKGRAMRAEAVLKRIDVIPSEGSDARYPALRRFLAKRFHPDHAPGDGIEKIIRSEIFKEIWGEIGRIDAIDR